MPEIFSRDDKLFGNEVACIGNDRNAQGPRGPFSDRSIVKLS